MILCARLIFRGDLKGYLTNMKQKNYSLYVFVIFGVLFFCISLIAFINYKIDYYSVFSNKPFFYEDCAGKPVNYPNYSFLRLKHFLNHEQYDSIFFSSSRAMSWDIKNNFGDNWYRLVFNQGDVTADYLKALRIIVKTKKIKEVFLLLDNFNFSQTSYVIGKEGLNRLSYPVTFFEKIKFYTSYLFAYPDRHILYALLGRYVKKTMTLEDRHPAVAGDMFDAARKKPYDRLQDEEHLSKMSAMKPNVFIDYHLRLVDGLSEINHIVQLCKENDIKLTIVINPFYYKNFFSFNLYYMEYWKQALSKIHAFYDFSGINKYTIDDRCWYEYSHYTKLVANSIFYAVKNNHFGDFGSFVTSSTVKEHNKKLRDEAVDFLHNNSDIFRSSSFVNKFRTLFKDSEDVVIHGSYNIYKDCTFFDLFNIDMFDADKKEGILSFYVIGANANFKWDMQYAPEVDKIYFNCLITAPKKTFFKLRAGRKIYSYDLNKGLNQINIQLDGNNLSDSLQIFPGGDTGYYEIKKMEIIV